eukprot:5464350-Pyramimonas_sp.AAC.1
MRVLSTLVVRSTVLVSCPGLLAFLLHGPLLPALQDLLQRRAQNAHAGGAGDASASPPSALVFPTLEVTAGARAAGRSVVRHFVATFI